MKIWKAVTGFLDRACDSIADQSLTVSLVIVVAGLCWMLVSRLGIGSIDDSGAAIRNGPSPIVAPARGGQAASTVTPMDMSLTPEQERRINEALRDGHYRNTADVIDDALQALEEKKREGTVSGADPATGDRHVWRAESPIPR